MSRARNIGTDENPDLGDGAVRTSGKGGAASGTDETDKRADQPEEATAPYVLETLEIGLRAAHEAPNGAAFAEFVKRANASLAAFGAHGEHVPARQIPEAPPLDADLAARVEADRRVLAEAADRRAIADAKAAAAEPV